MRSCITRLLSSLGETDEMLDILSQSGALEEVRKEDIRARMAVNVEETRAEAEIEQRLTSEGTDGFASRSSAAVIRADRESN